MTIADTSAAQVEQDDEPTYISPVQAATYLGYKPFTVLEMCDFNRIASTEWNGVLWVEVESLREFGRRIGIPEGREL